VDRHFAGLVRHRRNIAGALAAGLCAAGAVTLPGEVLLKFHRFLRQTKNIFGKIRNRFPIDAHQTVMNAAKLLPFCKFTCILFAVSKWA
jgi:hypothetical protein